MKDGQRGGGEMHVDIDYAERFRTYVRQRGVFFVASILRHNTSSAPGLNVSCS